MNLKQDMEREQMRTAILNQEQIFRQQGLKIEHFICLQSAQYAEFSLHLNLTRSAKFLTTLFFPTEGTEATGVVPCPEAADAAGTDDYYGDRAPGAVIHVKPRP